MIALITGGSRSGKSTYALERGESVAAGNRTFIATCPRIDDEMEERIRRHQAEREGRGWQTVEEQTDLVRALRDTDAPIVVVDCLSLWVNNMMYADGEIDEDSVADRCERFLDACGGREGTVLAVTNEVGLGVVPDNALARRYRDLLGRCNQTVAAGADEVVFMVSGIPNRIK